MEDSLELRKQNLKYLEDHEKIEESDSLDEELEAEKQKITKKVKDFITESHLETLFPYKDKHEYKTKISEIEEKLLIQKFF